MNLPQVDILVSSSNLFRSVADPRQIANRIETAIVPASGRILSHSRGRRGAVSLRFRKSHHTQRRSLLIPHFFDPSLK
jgi:hypothetical protein